MKKSNLLLAILAGAAAGAIVGVLYAPAKGSQTRCGNKCVSGLQNCFSPKSVTCLSSKNNL